MRLVHVVLECLLKRHLVAVHLQVAQCPGGPVRQLIVRQLLAPRVVLQHPGEHKQFLNAGGKPLGPERVNKPAASRATNRPFVGGVSTLVGVMAYGFMQCERQGVAAQ